MEAFPLKLAGAYGSPYSLKMRAVLRYRQIPFVWILRNSEFDDLGTGPVALLPAIGFPDTEGNYGDVQVDSSPLIMRLESLEAKRSLVPSDPVVAFLDYLVEDYGDEWLTKAMYHYRWYYAEDIAKASRFLPLDQDLQMDLSTFEQGQRYITKRQVSRMALVGSTEQNRLTIESSYERLLDLLEAHLATHPYLLGRRPGRGDFGVFGQLSQLIGFDPASSAVAVGRAPRVVNWATRTDDLSWLPVDEGTGFFHRDELPSTLSLLLGEIGRTYAPFMVANAKALRAGKDEVIVQIDGAEYRQGTFKYQAKCLEWLQQEFERLIPADRAAVNGILDGTGCEQLLNS